MVKEKLSKDSWSLKIKFHILELKLIKPAIRDLEETKIVKDVIRMIKE